MSQLKKKKKDNLKKIPDISQSGGGGQGHMEISYMLLVKRLSKNKNCRQNVW